ncbi:MAG TPA: flagellar hook-basal body protein [Candidatus Hydrogenedentes bacterium]|nr:flagellar hook-basal body protein [Candidatus Hydrogenedentota bacterium]HPC15812.1 flagellar hook-basal body protein [Candidatus Hydrogenedentota bacterium]HRT19779.1 flagellar hook-basal body protein [Candidatus Hydrogenedentota bacterium]HRT64553.1 flagellar hook-basal body protein [Candidatus Hydrogenedentota bacterium]
MQKSLYTAAVGMVAVEERQAVIANNIANASTTGFRRQQPVQKGFYEILTNTAKRPAWFDSQIGPGGGAQMVETFTDTAAGAFTATDDPLNIALSGPGYLAVSTPSGERFTRAGALTIDVNKQLATSDGFPVMGQGSQPIAINGTDVQIAGDGTVQVDGQAVGKLRLVEFEDPHMLERQGHNLYRASEAALGRSSEASGTTIHSKTLELSNVNMPKEMVSMISALRVYEANQKVIATADETMGRLIEQVGAPA